jgi:ABC-type multidrug transport system permease subunit
MAQMFVRSYPSLDEFQQDAAILAASNWEVATSITKDTRKGSWGWFLFWLLIGGPITAGFGWIACIFTFPRGKVTYNITYQRG